MKWDFELIGVYRERIRERVEWKSSNKFHGNNLKSPWNYFRYNWNVFIVWDESKLVETRFWTWTWNFSIEMESNFIGISEQSNGFSVSIWLDMNK